MALPTKISGFQEANELEDGDEFMLARGGETYKVSAATMAEGFGGGGGNEVDAPPETPHALDDEFDGSGAIDGDWTWETQGTATAVRDRGALLMTALINTSFHCRYVWKAAPSGAFVVTTKISVAQFPVDYHGCGLLVANGSSQIMAASFGDFSGGQTKRVDKFNSPTSYNGNAGQSDSRGERYLRIVRTAGGTPGLGFEYSQDGRAWRRLHGETIANFIGAVDRVGLWVCNAEANFDFPVSFEWFRVEE